MSHSIGGPDGATPRRHRQPQAAQWRLGRRSTIALAALVGCVIGGVVALATTGGNASDNASGPPATSSSAPLQQTSSASSKAPAKPTATKPTAPPPARQVSSTTLAGLPQATTEGRITTALADQNPTGSTKGEVVHPAQTVPIYGRPGGSPIAALPAVEVGGPTWLPVVAQQPGWLEVLLPTKPNGRVGWLADTPLLTKARSTYQVRVDVEHFKLTLINNGTTVGTWTIGTGSKVDPTPTGRTFILGAFTDPQQTYSPVILPLGIHSATLDTFGGGPGTVAIHTWVNRPTQNVFGAQTSNGCIRVPPDALSLIEKAPLGTLVLIH